MPAAARETPSMLLTTSAPRSVLRRSVKTGVIGSCESSYRRGTDPRWPRQPVIIYASPYEASAEREFDQQPQKHRASRNCLEMTSGHCWEPIRGSFVEHGLLSVVPGFVLQFRLKDSLNVTVEIPR